MRVNGYLPLVRQFALLVLCRAMPYRISYSLSVPNRRTQGISLPLSSLLVSQLAHSARSRGLLLLHPLLLRSGGSLLLLLYVSFDASQFVSRRSLFDEKNSKARALEQDKGDLRSIVNWYEVNRF